jgi:hypothetical protein
VCHVGGGARGGQFLRRARGEVAVGGTRISARLCVIGQGITSVRQTPGNPGIWLGVGGDRWVGHTGSCRRRVDRWLLSLGGRPGPVEGGGDSGDLGGVWPGGGRLGARAPTYGDSANAVSRCRRSHSARTIASACSSNAFVSVSVVTFVTPFRWRAAARVVRR